MHCEFIGCMYGGGGCRRSYFVFVVPSCGPCLHSALIHQPVTAQMLRDIPSVAGPALEGTCPVCRHILAGGWGKGLRGAVLRMSHVQIPVQAAR